MNKVVKINTIVFAGFMSEIDPTYCKSSKTGLFPDGEHNEVGTVSCQELAEKSPAARHTF